MCAIGFRLKLTLPKQRQEVSLSSTLIDFSNSLADAVERAGQSVVAIVEGGQTGVSGTIWREGVVVTAAHTLRGREEVTFVLPSGDTTTAKVAGRDPGTDIAALRFSASGVGKAQLAPSAGSESRPCGPRHWPPSEVRRDRELRNHQRDR